MKVQTVLAVVSTFTKQCERLASLFPASRHHGTPSLTDTGKVHPACEGAMIDLPFHYSMAVIVLADDYRFIVTGVLLLGFPLGACRSLCYLASPSGPAVRHLNEFIRISILVRVTLTHACTDRRRRTYNLCVRCSVGRGSQLSVTVSSCQHSHLAERVLL